MSDEQKYQELLKEIGQSIKAKNDTICILGFKVSNLERELKDAHKTIEELRKEKNHDE